MSLDKLDIREASQLPIKISHIMQPVPIYIRQNYGSASYIYHYHFLMASLRRLSIE